MRKAIGSNQHLKQRKSKNKRYAKQLRRNKTRIADKVRRKQKNTSNSWQTKNNFFCELKNAETPLPTPPVD